MSQLKVVLGVAGACAVCCAIPIGGALLATAAASSMLALFSETYFIAGAVSLAVVAAGAGLMWWRRRRVSPLRVQAAGCGCAATPLSSEAGCTPTACKVNP